MTTNQVVDDTNGNPIGGLPVTINNGSGPVGIQTDSTGKFNLPDGYGIEAINPDGLGHNGNYQTKTYDPRIVPIGDTVYRLPRS